MWRSILIYGMTGILAVWLTGCALNRQDNSGNIGPVEPVRATVSPTIPQQSENGDGLAAVEPTQEPTVEPTQEPVAEPTQEPTAEPTQEPIAEPTQEPDPEPPQEPLPEAPPAPLAPPIPALPAGATVGFCHRVQHGETLENLAQVNGTTSRAIQVANDLHPPYHIYIQQALFIPTIFGSGPNYYIVQEGDTLDTIAATCNLPANFIAWVNKFEESIMLVSDQVIQIPIPPFPPPSRFPHPQAGPYGPPSVFPPPGYGAHPPQHDDGHHHNGYDDSCDYVVQYGDTLYSLARYFGVSVKKLMTLNGIYNADTIYAGQCLRIPDGW